MSGREAILSDSDLVRAQHPGTLKALVREKTCAEFRAGGFVIIDDAEWEDDLGWHYRVSDEPLRHRGK